MKSPPTKENDRKMGSVFERFLTPWVPLHIIAGLALGRIAPAVARYLDGPAITVNGAPVVSIPIAVGFFFMMYPIMKKIGFKEEIAEYRIKSHGDQPGWPNVKESRRRASAVSKKD